MSTASNNGGTQKKGTFVDAFVEGAKNGLQIAITSTIPNVVFAYVVIAFLNISGLMDLIEVVFDPIMGIFGLPGEAAAVLAAAFLSMSGATGAEASLFAEGSLSAAHVTILLPAIYLMGSQMQYLGRVIGTSGMNPKYIPLLFGMSFMNAAISMWIMNVILIFFV